MVSVEEHTRSASGWHVLTILELDRDRLVGAFHEKPRPRTHKSAPICGRHIQSETCYISGLEIHVPDQLHLEDAQISAGFENVKLVGIYRGPRQLPTCT